MSLRLGPSFESCLGHITGRGGLVCLSPDAQAGREGVLWTSRRAGAERVALRFSMKQGLQVCDTQVLSGFRLFAQSLARERLGVVSPPPLAPPSCIHKPFQFSLRAPDEGKPDRMKGGKRGKEQGARPRGWRDSGEGERRLSQGPFCECGDSPWPHSYAPPSGLASPAESQCFSAMDWTASSSPLLQQRAVSDGKERLPLFLPLKRHQYNVSEGGSILPAAWESGRKHSGHPLMV